MLQARNIYSSICYWTVKLFPTRARQSTGICLFPKSALRHLSIDIAFCLPCLAFGKVMDFKGFSFPYYNKI